MGPFGFAGSWGYQGDSNSGLQLLGHRYYDSTTGRFLTRDIAKCGSNWYSYCSNSPLNRIDSQGLWAILINLGGQIIIPGRSGSLSISISIGSGGVGVGSTVGSGPAFGAYLGAGAGISYDNDLDLRDPNSLHWKGEASGIATPTATVELADDDGNLLNGGINGGGISFGPGSIGGIYHEHRGSGFLSLF